MDFLTVFAHGSEEVMEKITPNLGDIVRANSIKFTILASILLIILLVLSHFFKEINQTLKKILFWGMILVIAANTAYLTSATVYLNLKSNSGGPVHYHADFEIWSCGRQLEFEHSQGLSNKVGTSLIHTHDDKRMHVEGVILDTHELSLGHIVEEMGGGIDSNMLIIPTEEGKVSLKTGESCPDGKAGKLQVFVYKTEGKFYTQQKLADFKNYQISPYTQVPPGDCVIFDFDSVDKYKTDKMCLSYQVARQTGKIYER